MTEVDSFPISKQENLDTWSTSLLFLAGNADN